MSKCYDLEVNIGPLCIGVSVDLAKFWAHMASGESIRPTMSIGKGENVRGASFEFRPFVGMHRSIILYD